MKQTLSVKTYRISDLDPKNRSELIKLCDPRYCGTYPSICRFWYDFSDGCEYVIEQNFLVAKTITFDGSASWTASGSLNSQNDYLRFVEICEFFEIKYFKYCSDNFTSSLLKHDKKELFSFKPSDETGYDYLYDVKEISGCSGGKFEDLRRQLKKFNELYSDKITIKITTDKKDIVQSNVMHLFDDWLEFGTDGSKSPEAEVLAIDRFFEQSGHKYFGNMIAIEIFHLQSLVALSINELVDSKSAINHFQKANLNMSGISYYLFYKACETLKDAGIEILNFQEDAGIPGLRQFKNKLRPSAIWQSFDIIINRN